MTTVTLRCVISNLTAPQAIALAAMLKRHESLGSEGSSRSVSFDVDGGGTFHPKVALNFDPPVPEFDDDHLRGVAEIASNCFSSRPVFEVFTETLLEATSR